MLWSNQLLAGGPHSWLQLVILGEAKMQNGSGRAAPYVPCASAKQAGTSNFH